MARICGVTWTERDDVQISGCLERLYYATWHETPRSAELWHDRHVALGHITVGAANLEPQPIFSTDRRWAIVFCGKLFDTQGLRAVLEREGVDFQFPDNDGELLLYLFRHSGTTALSQLNGLFSAAVWDAPRRRLWLVTDRYGFRLLYYYHSSPAQTLVFSSRLRAILASGLYDFKVNWQSWSVFLHFGHCLGDDTFYDGLRVVPPGSILRFADNQVHLEQYWSINSIETDHAVTRDDATERYIDHFARAVQRRNIPVVGKKVVFLSGGLDSCRIAAELVRQGCDFTTYTTRGFSRVNTDGPLARRCAESLGIANTFVNLPARRFLETYWGRATDLLDYQTDLHQWLLPLVDRLPEDVRVNYDGIAGDIVPNAVRRDSCFYADPSLIDIRLTRPREMAVRIAGPAMAFNHLHRQIRESLSFDCVLDAVVAELGKYANTENILTAFYLLNRTRRAITLSPFGLILQKAETFCPYLDNDLLEFTMSLPLTLRMAHTLRRETLNRAYPELASLSTSAQESPRARNVRHRDDIRYDAQRRQWLLNRLWSDFICRNWMFNNPRAMRHVLGTVGAIWRSDRPAYLFSRSFCVFYAWLDRYRTEVGL